MRSLGLISCSSVENPAIDVMWCNKKPKALVHSQAKNNSSTADRTSTDHRYDLRLVFDSSFIALSALSLYIHHHLSRSQECQM
jgi:hypothetical protein